MYVDVYLALGISNHNDTGMRNDREFYRPCRNEIFLAFVRRPSCQCQRTSHEMARCTSNTIVDASCLDSYAGTITRLRNRQLEDEKIVFLCRSLFRSQSHIIEAYTEGQAIFQEKLPVHRIDMKYDHSNRQAAQGSRHGQHG